MTETCTTCASDPFRAGLSLYHPNVWHSFDRPDRGTGIIAGGDATCGPAEATSAITVTAAMSAYADKELISVASDLVWSSYTSKRGIGVIPGGDTPCEDACSICGGPNIAAFDGDGWCDGCDTDARLAGDDLA